MPTIELFERDASEAAREKFTYSVVLREHGDAGSGGLQVSRNLQ